MQPIRRGLATMPSNAIRGDDEWDQIRLMQDEVPGEIELRRQDIVERDHAVIAAIPAGLLRIEVKFGTAAQRRHDGEKSVRERSCASVAGNDQERREGGVLRACYAVFSGCRSTIGMRRVVRAL